MRAPAGGVNLVGGLFKTDGCGRLQNDGRPATGRDQRAEGSEDGRDHHVGGSRLDITYVTAR